MKVINNSMEKKTRAQRSAVVVCLAAGGAGHRSSHTHSSLTAFIISQCVGVRQVKQANHLSALTAMSGHVQGHPPVTLAVGCSDKAGRLALAA